MNICSEIDNLRDCGYINCGIVDESCAQYYTNGNFYEVKPKRNWNPATNATFDTGIFVINNSKSGCL